MNIAIFESVTTDDHINALKEESEKYTGLYVDMNNAPERKYVKEKAEEINKLLKQVDRKRIDLSKEYKIKVEAEASDIKERLEIANLPFTLLIDEHKAERKKILDAEKARVDAIEQAEKLEQDHEMALLINKTFEYDRATAIQQEKEAEALRVAEREEYAKEQVIIAEERQKQLIKAQERDKINQENARLANKEHVRNINNSILEAMLQSTTLPREQLKLIIRAIARNEIPNVKISY